MEDFGKQTDQMEGQLQAAASIGFVCHYQRGQPSLPEIEPWLGDVASVATVKTSTSIHKRPVTKLCVFPVQDSLTL
ncbi:hypothetical protein ILUMI_18190 [Ignelater luminosus]|uniref:Uncharacterized protein n=1 Tax=Ignelater luminosus TaxID=2038154 RepID=A0A8K0G753_IGNLU|nr:hypothetical protein ILUMI_18190 [Ignelater luminosus]